MSYTTKSRLQGTTAVTLVRKFTTSTLRTDLKEFFQKNFLFLVEMSSFFGYNEEGVTLRLKTETILFGKSFLEHSQFRPGDKNILTQAQRLMKLP